MKVERSGAKAAGRVQRTTGTPRKTRSYKRVLDVREEKSGGAGSRPVKDVRGSGKGNGRTARSTPGQAIAGGVGVVGEGTQKHQVILGMDPGVNTGVARFLNGELIELFTIEPHEIEEWLRKLGPQRVVYEDSRLQSRTWTARSKSTIGAALATSRSLGQVDAICSLIVAICEKLGIAAHGISPKDKGAKRTAENFGAVTGWTGGSNQHTRDAAMVAWPYRRAAL